MFWRDTRKESSYGSAFGWCPTSEELLLGTEAHLLAGVQSLEEGVFVDIGPVVGPEGDRVLTYRANSSSPNTPLLLVHGFAAGSGLWCLNIDALAQHRPVYVIDVLGFGRSSRPCFSSDPHEAEDQFVRSIEAWRRVMGLDKFYLLGHSFGGYLCTLYSMKHPERVEHLVLVDPWGFPVRPSSYRLPVWALPIEFGAACVLPLFALRAAGPLGYLYLRLVPPFQTRNFESVSNAPQATADYFWHMNVKKPSGEVAFHKLMEGIAWGRFPMLPRMGGLRKEVPITFLYGEKSWVWKSTGFKIQKMRSESYVDVQVVAGAGHVVSSDQPLIFNAVVNRVLCSVDSGLTPSNPLTAASILAKDITGRVKLGSDGPSGSHTAHQGLQQQQQRDLDVAPGLLNGGSSSKSRCNGLVRLEHCVETQPPSGLQEDEHLEQNGRCTENTTENNLSPSCTSSNSSSCSSLSQPSSLSEEAAVVPALDKSRAAKRLVSAST